MGRVKRPNELNPDEEVVNSERKKSATLVTKPMVGEIFTIFQSRQKLFRSSLNTIQSEK